MKFEYSDPNNSNFKKSFKTKHKILQRDVESK